jgi:hypothetical protein
MKIHSVFSANWKQADSSPMYSSWMSNHSQSTREFLKLYECPRSDMSVGSVIQVGDISSTCRELCLEKQ